MRRGPFSSSKTVIELALANEIDATVTGPYQQKSLSTSWSSFAGHTEIYATTPIQKYAMPLVEDKLKLFTYPRTYPCAKLVI